MKSNTFKKLVAAFSLLGVFGGAGAALDNRYAKAANVEGALKDVHHGLKNLQLGQWQTARALLSRELFEYQMREGRLTPLERQRKQTVEGEIRDLERRIETLQRAQDAR